MTSSSPHIGHKNTTLPRSLSPCRGGVPQLMQTRGGGVPEAQALPPDLGREELGVAGVWGRFRGRGQLWAPAMTQV